MTNLTDIFVGDDIGKSFHCPAAINARGHVLLKPVKVIASAEAFTAFEGRLDRLGDKTAVVIGLEASGHDWMSPWRFLLERDWQVQVFNPLLSSKSARTHLQGRKTDADDALFIARTVRDGDFVSLRPGASPAASGWRPKGARTRGIFTSKADIARYIEAHNKGAPNPSNGPTGRRIR